MRFNNRTEVEIDDYILNQMIYRCFGYGHIIKVTNKGGKWIQLKNHTLSWINMKRKEISKNVKLIQAKELLIPRIYRMKCFYYQDDFNYIYDGKWIKTNKI